MKHGEKWFPEKLSKFVDFKLFSVRVILDIRTSKGRAPASELVLLRGGCPPRSHMGGSLESKIVYRGQWRNEFEWRPTAKFKWRPYKVQHF